MKLFAPAVYKHFAATRLITLLRNCGREVKHLIVDRVDDGSSPFSSANFVFRSPTMREAMFQ